MRIRGPVAFLAGVGCYLLVTAAAGTAQGTQEPDFARLRLVTPDGGDIKFLETSASTLYAVGFGGGLFRSGNSGAAWTRASAGLPNLDVFALSVDPSQPDTAFVATFTQGIARTQDGGTTWTPVNTGMPVFGDFIPGMLAFAFDPTSSSIVYTAGNGGVYKSTDGGGTWTFKGLGVRGLTHIEVAPSDATVVWTSDLSTVWRSVNSGGTWTFVGNTLPQGSLGALAIDPHNPAVAFVADKKLWKTTNAGTTWTSLSACTIDGVADVEIDPADSNTVFVACANAPSAPVRKSTNGGTSFVTVATGVPAVTPRQLEISGSNIFLAHSEGVHRSTNGGAGWSPAQTGLHLRSARFAQFAGDDVVFAGGTNGSRIFIARNAAIAPAVRSSLVHQEAPTLIDKGNPPMDSLSGLWVSDGFNGIDGLPRYPAFAASYSTDIVTTPSDVRYELFSSQFVPQTSLVAFNVDATDPTRAIAGGNSGGATSTLYDINLLGTPASPSVWVDAGFPPVPGFITALYKPNATQMMVASTEGLFLVTKGGAAVPFEGIPQHTSVHQLIVTSGGQQIIVSVSGIVKSSTDGGKTFTNDTGPNFDETLSLAYQNLGGFAVAGTKGRGVFTKRASSPLWTKSFLALSGVAVQSVDLRADGALTLGTNEGVFIADPETSVPLAPLTVTITPEHPTVDQGETVPFVCAASGGTPPYTFTGDVIAGAGTAPFTFDAFGSSASLTIPTVTVDENYAFAICVAFDSAGRKATDLTDLTIKNALLDKNSIHLAKRRPGANARAALTTAAGTPATPVTVRAGGKGHPWTAAADQSWIKLTNPAGDGVGQFLVGLDESVSLASGSYTGTVTVTEATRGTSQSVSVALKVVATSDPPTGSLDTPANGATLDGSIPVTGWTVDDIGVQRVEIWRNCVETVDRPGGNCRSINGSSPDFVFVDNANFITGARPDIEGAFPTTPQAGRAGWGYLMLSLFLPHVPAGTPFGGQGNFTLYAYAVDEEGQYSLLGSKNVTLDNDHATTPFGAIDTPAQGGSVTTSPYVNFGWAMAPGSTCLNTASTATYDVYIDGVPRTLTPSVNWIPGNERADLVAAFPAACNARDALAAYIIDVNALGLAAGVHTIFWVVRDTAGHAAGIGSRFFTIALGSSAVTASLALPQLDRQTTHQKLALAPSSGQVRAHVGFGDEPFVDVKPASDGTLLVTVPGLGRVVLDLDGAVDNGHEEVAGKRRALPAGSTLDTPGGRFSWAPPIGFRGDFRLVFIAGDREIPVTVRVR